MVVTTPRRSSRCWTSLARRSERAAKAVVGEVARPATTVVEEQAVEELPRAARGQTATTAGRHSRSSSATFQRPWRRSTSSPSTSTARPAGPPRPCARLIVERRRRHRGGGPARRPRCSAAGSCRTTAAASALRCGRLDCRLAERPPTLGREEGVAERGAHRAAEAGADPVDRLHAVVDERRRRGHDEAAVAGVQRHDLDPLPVRAAAGAARRR